MSMSFLSTLLSTEIFHRGIVLLFPSSYAGNNMFSVIVDRMLANMPGITAGDIPPEPNPLFRVAYTGNYVLYFTATPSSVPGYDPRDYPSGIINYEAEAHDHYSTEPGLDIVEEDLHDMYNKGIEIVMNPHRAHLRLSSQFVQDFAIDYAAVSSRAQSLSQSLDTLYTMPVVDLM